jgi:hypothetical protein
MAVGYVSRCLQEKVFSRCLAEYAAKDKWGIFHNAFDRTFDKTFGTKRKRAAGMDGCRMVTPRKNIFEMP